MASFKDFQDDLEVAMNKISTGKPLFIYAHSMGGAFILTQLLRNPNMNVAGIIFYSPLTGFPKKLNITAVTQNIFEILPEFLDNMVINARVSPTDCSSDLNEQHDIINDPLTTPIICFRGMRAILNMIQVLNTTPRNQNIKTPVLVLTGAQDRITLHDLAEKMFSRFSFHDKEEICYDKGHHQLANDFTFPQMKEDCIKWLNKRLEKAPEHTGNFMENVSIKADYFVTSKLFRTFVLAIFYYILRKIILSFY